jgi:hypothetical protein
MTSSAAPTTHSPESQTSRWPRWADRVALGAASGVLAASFLPWGRSGAVDRSSYDLVAAAVDLDVLEGGAAQAARAWYLLPAVLGAAWLAGALGRPLLSTALAAVIGASGLTLAVVTVRSPLVEQPATTFTAIAGAIAISAALAGWLGGRSKPDVRSRSL